MDASWAEGFSSSSLPIPPQWVYDVFVSFRGADTRKNFTSHLFAALEDNGFRTFRDGKELERGEFISDGLLKAIEGSRISLIVFSKDYAGSRWCLDELVRIMDCRETLKQIVVPIFYDVVPSDVRNQAGILQDAFAKHEKRFREGSDGKVEKWRAALTVAANLSSLHLLNEANGDETELIKMIHIWLGRFLPRPSALAGGGEIVGPIALSSSEFAATNKKAQRVGQDKSGSTASDSENKRTREQEDREDIYTSITLDDLRQHYGRKRKDAAESLGVSVSTLKRTCRKYGIMRWPNIIRKKAGRPRDQYVGKIPSPTWNMLSTNGQTELENQMVGHLEETNEFLLDFVEGPNGGVSSEWAFQLKNQWTVSTSYPNSNGPEVPHPHIASTQILGENMGSLGDGRNSFCSPEKHLLQGQISGSMWTVPPCSDPVSSQHIPTISPTMGSSEDRINSLAFLQDVLLEDDVCGSISWTIPSCSEPAPGQLMPTVPRTTGSSDDLRNLLPSVEESFLAGHVSGFINPIVPSCSYPALSQPMSTVPHTIGSSDDLRNLLASVEEPSGAGHVSESINLTVPSCSDPTPSQSVPTILHTIPTNSRMMPLLTERQDTRSMNLKATYVDTTIKFQFPLASGINELKEEVSKILKCELGSFDIEYEDEDGDWILMARDKDVREYLQLLTSLGKQVTKLKVRGKVPKP